MTYLTGAYVGYLEEKRADDVERISASEIAFGNATYIREAAGAAFVRADA